MSNGYSDSFFDFVDDFGMLSLDELLVRFSEVQDNYLSGSATDCDFALSYVLLLRLLEEYRLALVPLAPPVLIPET